jgi:hypothetical protein
VGIARRLPHPAGDGLLLAVQTGQPKSKLATQQSPESEKPRGPGRPKDKIMEIQIMQADLRQCVCVPSGHDVGLHRAEIFVRPAFCGQPRRSLLQRKPRVVDLHVIAGCKRSHSSATARPEFQQAFLLKHQQRFPDRDPADTKPVRRRNLRHWRPGRKLTRENFVTQPGSHGISEGSTGEYKLGWRCGFHCIVYNECIQWTDLAYCNFFDARRRCVGNYQSAQQRCSAASGSNSLRVKSVACDESVNELWHSEIFLTRLPENLRDQLFVAEGNGSAQRVFDEPLGEPARKRLSI